MTTSISGPEGTTDIDDVPVDAYLDRLESNFAEGNFSTADDLLFTTIRSMNKDQLWLLASVLSAKASHYARLWDNAVCNPRRLVESHEDMCRMEAAAGEKIWTRLDNPEVPYVDHELKTVPQPFQAVWDGTKRYEIRDNSDRDYQVGQSLKLREYDPASGYTGREILANVLYMSRGGEWGLPDNVDVLSIEVARRLHGK